MNWNEQFQNEIKNTKELCDQTITSYVDLSLAFFVMMPDGSPASSGPRLVTGLTLVDTRRRIQTNQKSSILKEYKAKSLKCILLPGRQTYHFVSQSPPTVSVSASFLVAFSAFQETSCFVCVRHGPLLPHPSSAELSGTDWAGLSNKIREVKAQSDWAGPQERRKKTTTVKYYNERCHLFVL